MCSVAAVGYTSSFLLLLLAGAVNFATARASHLQQTGSAPHIQWRYFNFVEVV